MYESYEHIVFLIWFNDLFGILAVEIFHNNSLWQPKLLLIRWKLMQMSNVNKFVIHKSNTLCWSETGLTRVQQETPKIRATSSCCEQNTERKGFHLQNLSIAKLFSFSIIPVLLSACFLNRWALTKKGFMVCIWQSESGDAGSVPCSAFDSSCEVGI